MIKTLFSRQFVVAFLLTLLCSLAGSFLGGLPYLSVIGALVIALILGMLMQFAQPAVAYSQPGIGLISGNCLDSRDADAVCSARRCLQSAWNWSDLQ